MGSKEIIFSDIYARSITMKLMNLMKQVWYCNNLMCVIKLQLFLEIQCGFMSSLKQVKHFKTEMVISF